MEWVQQGRNHHCAVGADHRYVISGGNAHETGICRLYIDGECTSIAADRLVDVTRAAELIEAEGQPPEGNRKQRV
ncbi:hypothetical protein H7J07_06170 [Mycobacterium koreense]|uniref:hypothetical protein n=1 Tax=Mycolicibacillus koreensis TaxID=1069220 RepID=UPI001055F9EC|nr:hypothetical protein [Mycolicibacillus koreensis]MCV7247813.1 hypothetical protein [Mycolicibacillus koreensis]